MVFHGDENCSLELDEDEDIDTLGSWSHVIIKNLKMRV